MITGVSAERSRLAELLSELDLKPTERGSNGIEIVFDGVYATIMVYGDGSLSLMCSVRAEGQQWDLGRINAANNRVRFAKFSEVRGNLLLEADYVFHVASPDAADQLRQVLALWRLALHELHNLVEELVPA